MWEIAPDVAIVPMTIANAYLVGDSAGWVVVDCGIPGSAGKIRRAAAARFGPQARPAAVILTHGHFDHAGSAAQLAGGWGVRIYAHRLEWPYLTGQSAYPPLDPTPPGFFSQLSRVFPSRTVNLGDRLEDLRAAGRVPVLDAWECIATPGHTPGHVSLFRRSDGVLLAGDAVTTMDLDSLPGTLLRRPKLCRPPAPATFNWEQARRSVERLAELRPTVIAAGHGLPLHHAAGELDRLARNFKPPARGRYVAAPVEADETGVTRIPPRPFDPVPLIAAGVAVGLAGSIAFARWRRTHSAAATAPSDGGAGAAYSADAGATAGAGATLSRQ